MDRSKKIIIAFIILAVLIVAGVYFYQIFISSQSNQKQAAEEAPASMVIVNNFFGNIAAISSDKKSLTVEDVSAMGTNVPDEHKTKTVLIDDKTEFVAKQYKSQEQFNQELADVKAKSKNGLLIAPSPLVEQKITMGDLKIGDRINFVFSPKEGELSANSDQLLATQINVFP